MNTNPTISPTPPNAPAKMIRGKRNIRIVEDIFTVGVVKEASADNATAINKIVLVKALNRCLPNYNSANNTNRLADFSR